MRPRTALLLALLLVASGTVAGIRPAAAARPADVRASRFTSPAPRMQPVLSSSASARLAGGERAALWVFFTDKGVPDALGFDRAVRAAGATMSARAKSRRSRETGGRFVPDATDLPVPAPYVDAVRSAGADIRHVSRWLNAASVWAGADEARRIASLPFVRAILPVRASRRPETVGDVVPAPPGTGDDEGGLRAPAPGGTLRGVEGLAPALPKPSAYGPSITQLTSINVPAAHDSGWSGANEILAMFDTGFNKSHNATFQLNRLAERDFVFGDGETANQAGDVTSAWDHGTGTWSVAGGYWVNNLVGPAFNATFILAKTEDVRSETPVEEDNWVAAAEWADSIGADVISSSLAYFDFDGTVNDFTYSDLDGYTTVVTLGAVFAQRHGIVVCNSNSNEGPNPGSLWAPADADSIVSVGAVDNSNVVATFSSRGPTFDGRIKPEVVAQGVNTYWAVASNNSAIGLASGTSLSAPLVAGCAALVREAHPDWSVAQVRSALMETADSAATPDNDRGWGRINVIAAIYNSSLGPPIYPKPFDLRAPGYGTTITALPVTLRWRRSIDPDPGDAVSYEVKLYDVLTPGQIVYQQTVTDTFALVTGYIGPSRTYEWTVTAMDNAGHPRPARGAFRFTTGATTDVALPPSVSRVVLYQSRPNPARRAADIPFVVGGQGDPVHVTLRIFDPRGRLVRTLLDAEEPTARSFVIRWDGRDQDGRPVASGIYYYRLNAADREETRRLVLLR